MNLELWHPKHVASPTELVLDDHGFDAGAVSRVKDADDSTSALPADVENPSQTMLMVLLKGLKVTSMRGPRFGAFQKCQKDDCLLHKDLAISTDVTVKDSHPQVSEGGDGRGMDQNSICD
eukprot:g14897.t1